MNILDKLKVRARALKTETMALYLAFRDPRTPWYAKGWLGLVLAYALSPIDLIPDFIPVLGYLDDLILVPAGLALALKMIPSGVMDEARNKAAQSQGQSSALGRIGTAVIILIWILVAIWLIWHLFPLLGRIGK